MKELSIEQKAQRYDETIEKLRDFYRDYDTVSRLIDVKEELANLIPELKESREDEMIRIIKEVILNSVPYKINILTKDTTITAEEAIAWLEKQGKQKSIDDLTQQEAMDIAVAKCFEQGGQKPYGQREECVDCQFNYAGECKGSCAMKRGEQKPADKIEAKFKVGDVIREKETSNLFYVNSIEDFGYTLHYKDCIAKGCTMSFKYEDNYELVEQKPAWSEEDEKILDGVISNYESGYLPSVEKRDEIIKKLKSLKDRLQHQPKQEWSEEDKNMLQSILDEYKSMTIEKRNWLKYLKERYTWNPSDEQMKALSIAMCGVDDPLFSLYQDLKKLKG